MFCVQFPFPTTFQNSSCVATHKVKLYLENVHVYAIFVHTKCGKYKILYVHEYNMSSKRTACKHRMSTSLQRVHKQVANLSSDDDLQGQFTDASIYNGGTGKDQQYSQ